MSEQFFFHDEKAPSGEKPSPLRGPRKFGLAVALLALVVAGTGALWWWNYPDAAGPIRSATAIVDIPHGVGVAGVSRLLADARVVEDDIRFALLVKITGASKKLKAGEYAFAPGVTPRAVLGILSTGKVVQHAITLPEGLTVEMIADLVSAGGWGSREDFLRLAAEPEILGKFAIQKDSVEGYLFPDTYFFAKGTRLRAIIVAMLKRMDLVLAEEGVGKGETRIALPAPRSSSGNESVAQQTISLTRHEVLTLASIIEKETALSAERPLVGRVFLNRLRQGMKLQADPTVIYGLAKFGSSLTKRDLETNTPYNTYANRGLPVGPICNPSRTAIAAVIRPSAEDYYYFVAQGNGTHFFSTNLSEHNRAVSRYRKKRLSNSD